VCNFIPTPHVIYTLLRKQQRQKRARYRFDTGKNLPVSAGINFVFDTGKVGEQKLLVKRIFCFLAPVKMRNL